MQMRYMDEAAAAYSPEFVELLNEHWRKLTPGQSALYRRKYEAGVAGDILRWLDEVRPEGRAPHPMLAPVKKTSKRDYPWRRVAGERTTP